MEKKEKSKNIKIFAIFMLSNLCFYLLGSFEEESIYETTQPTIRPNYVSIKLMADLKTEVSSDMPLVITNHKRDLYIPYVFVKKKINQDENKSSYSEVPTSTYYLVSLHKKHINKILRQKHLQIFPLIDREQLLKQKKKGVRYEVHF